MVETGVLAPKGLLFVTSEQQIVSTEKQLLKICDEFAPDIDVQTAIWQLKEYMQSLVHDQQIDFQKSDDTVNHIKQEFVDDSIHQLEEAGVTVNGDTDNLVAGIQEQADIDRIQKNNQSLPFSAPCRLPYGRGGLLRSETGSELE